MNFDVRRIATPVFLVPLVFVVASTLLWFFNTAPKAEIGAGRVAYEAGPNGYQAAMTTKNASTVRVLQRRGDWVQVSFDSPRAKLWLPAATVAMTPGLGGSYLVDLEAGRLSPDQPPLREKITTTTVAGETWRSVGAYAPFALVVLAAIAMVVRRETLRTLAMLALAGALFLSSLYAAGLMKSAATRGDLVEMGLLGKVSTDGKPTLYCVSAAWQRRALAELGTRATVVAGAPGFGGKGYALWNGAPGAGWKLVYQYETIALWSRAE